MSGVYSNVKILHFPKKLRDLQRGAWSAPIHVRLKPTNRCNHRCGYCCYRNPRLFLGERMDERDAIPPAKMREVVRDLGRMGVRAVTFTGGGEPLCYPAIEETVRGLLKAGVRVAMLTNGALLQGPVARLLARRAAWVRVSMDAADRDLYAKQRDCPPSEFDRVCANIRDFAGIEGRRAVLGINLIVTRENRRDVFAFLKMAKGLVVDHVKISAAVVSTRPAGNAAYLSPFFKAVKAQIARGSATLADRRFAVIDRFHRPDEAGGAFQQPYARCPFAQCLTVIAADQNVYTCQDKAYTTRGLLGSIRRTSFRKLWFGEALQRRLRRLNPATDCRHHCVARGKNLMLLDYLEADQEHVDFV
jgi:MoaA/NifB/PqqE/SkfB family radical SAM enzyme